MLKNGSIVERTLEGCKGAGKGTVSAGVEKNLAAYGIRTFIFNPFTDVRLRHQAATGELDFGHLWYASPEKRKYAHGMVNDAVTKVRETAQEQDAHLIIWDRLWVTVDVILQTAALAPDEDRDVLRNQALQGMAPAYFLRISPEEVFRRRGTICYGEQSDEQAKEAVHEDCRNRDIVCNLYRDRILGIFHTEMGEDPFEEPIRVITEDLLAELGFPKR